MKFQVYRTHASSYQDSKFLANEKKVLEEIEQVHYIQSLQQFQPDSKLILISNTHTQPEMIPGNVLANTALMIHPNSGHDNLSESFRQSAQFPIIIGNPIRSHAVTEYAMACMFQHFTMVPHHHHWQTDRSFPRKLLRDQKVCLLGHGTIGKILATGLSGICPKLTVFDPHEPAQDISYKVVNQWSKDLLQDTQILIVAASLTPSSHHMIHSENISQLDSEALIINPARGEIIQEQALLRFLQKNSRAKAFVDVFENEPFAPGFAEDIKNLNKTSHIAGMYQKLNHDIISFEYLVIKDFISLYNSNQLESFKQEYSECLLET